VAWYPEANEHTIWPKRRSSYEFVFEDDYWRGHTWYRGGKKHWAYDAGYFKPVKDRNALYWTPNVLHVKTQIEDDVAKVHITSCTPNLKEYQARRRGGTWKRVDQHFTLQLVDEREDWLLRSVNLAGVCGPEYRLVIEAIADTQIPAGLLRDAAPTDCHAVERLLRRRILVMWVDSVCLVLRLHCDS
jgi:hypothetical protein